MSGGEGWTWVAGAGCGGGCAHGLVLGVVAEALGDYGVAEEEGEVGEDVLAGGGDGARGGELGRALLVGGVHGWLCRSVWLGCWSGGRPVIRLAAGAVLALEITWCYIV